MKAKDKILRKIKNKMDKFANANETKENNDE